MNAKQIETIRYAVYMLELAARAHVDVEMKFDALDASKDLCTEFDCLSMLDEAFWLDYNELDKAVTENYQTAFAPNPD